MVSRDWAEQHIHDLIVGSPCGFCPALNLGLRAISLSSSYTTPDEEKGSPRTIGERARTQQSSSPVFQTGRGG